MKFTEVDKLPGRKKKPMPENMQRISELAAKAREHGKSYGFYVAEIKA